MALAKRQVNPSRSSIALSRMAPPSELACGWSNFAMIGLEIPWTWRALCAIQAVAIEPPRFCAMSRLVNAPFAHFRGSMALFFHLSRIIRASGRSEIVESLTAPELLVVNPMTALHLAVLLRAPGLDVAVPNPQRLHGEGKGEGKLMPVVALELPDREGERAAQLAQKRQARALVQPAIEPQNAK